MNILITGGASGLGGAITKLLAKDTGNQVYFTYSKSAEKAQSIIGEYPNAKGISCDFSDAGSVKSFCSRLPEFDLDVLINNAYNGDFLKTYFHKISPDDFLADFTNNVMPVISIAQTAIAGFRKKKSGKIITILTAALAENPPIGGSVYIANKAYLEKLVKVWAGENVKYNITSNSVSPSLMQTDLTSSIDERMVEQIIQNHPLKRLLTVEEVAQTVSFLVHSSLHINGIDILINSATSIK